MCLETFDAAGALNNVCVQRKDVAATPACTHATKVRVSLLTTVPVSYLGRRASFRLF